MTGIGCVTGASSLINGTHPHYPFRTLPLFLLFPFYKKFSRQYPHSFSLSNRLPMVLPLTLHNLLRHRVRRWRSNVGALEGESAYELYIA